MNINENGITTTDKATFFKNFETTLQQRFGSDFKIAEGGALEALINMVWENKIALQNKIMFLASQYAPEVACGYMQDCLYERIGIKRLPEQKTVFSAQVYGEKKLDCKSKSITIRSKTDKNEFSNTSAFTITPEGTAIIDFQCTSSGEIHVNADDEFDIISAPYGIEKVIPAENFQISIGRERESDENYRTRFRVAKALRSCSSRFAMLSGLLQYVNSPKYLKIIDKKDNENMQAGQVEIVAHHNTTDEIFAQAIYDMSAEGVQYIGNTEIILKDYNNENVKIRFEKAEKVAISISATIKIKSGFSQTTVEKNAQSNILKYTNTRIWGLGETVYATEFIVPLLDTDGVEAVTQIKVQYNGEYLDYIKIKEKQIPVFTNLTILMS